MRIPAIAVVALAMSMAALPCAADVVGDVNDLALRTARATPPAVPRTLAIVNLAMFDAANAIERRYQPYRPQSAPPGGADADAAALGAGCAALAALHATQQADVAKTCEAIAGRLPATAATADGRRFGAAVGESLVAARRDDGFGAPNRYRPFAAPGTYAPTTLPIGTDAATARPFALGSAAQFRPGPPPALTSDTWARDFNETKATGSRASAERTPAQRDTALFWASAGPQQFIDSVPDFKSKGGTSPADRARYHALLYVTMVDAGIALFDAKYAYNFWRPLTAIRNGDLDGNDATERDAGWLPLIETPMHPEYPCAHCTVTAAMFTVVASFLPDGEPLALRAAASPGGAASPRQWKRLADASAEVADARVWSGVHFRTSTAAGAALGRAVGEWILATQLRPVAPAR